MPAALQCPDCGHQEMLDNLGGVSTFRCGGCGRALKVPAQFRAETAAPGSAPGSRPPGPGDQTQAMPRVSPGTAPIVAAGGAAPPVHAAPAPYAGVPVGSAPIAAAAATAGVGAAAGLGDGGSPLPTPEAIDPPLILRLVLWAIALPLGSLIVFAIAGALKVLTKTQLENTFLLAGWGRFVPIARLLPFCALATALIVQAGVFGLERLRIRNLSRGAQGRRGPGPGPGGGQGRRPTRPIDPGGRPQRRTNGARSRDRVTS